jgi:hypothetical protein
MRKITTEAVQAFMNGKNYTNGNTTVQSFKSNVTSDGAYTEMRLHSNKIAYQNRDGLFITLAGWNTTTTRERLNGLPGVRVNTKLGQAFLNGKKWDGEWIQVA